MNKDQGNGIMERVVYGAITFLILRFGSSFGLTPDDAAWIGGGAIALGGGAWAWWHNRPIAVINRAADALPDNANLIIAPTPNATPMERFQAVQLANAASDKVIVKTSL